MEKYSNSHFGYGFFFATIGFITVGVFSHQNAMDLQQATSDRAKARETKYAIESVISVIKDAETSQRGFLLTGREEYLDPYKNSLEIIDEKFLSLEKILDGDIEQEKSLEELKKISALKLEIIKKTIGLHKINKHSEAIKIVNTDLGKAYMDRMRTIVDNMKDLQTKRITNRSEHAEIILKRNRTVIIISSVFGSNLVIIAWIAMERSRRKKLQAEQKILRANEILEEQKQQLSEIIELQGKTEVELKIAKNKADAASKAKSEFLAGMTHEVRTPINGIMGITDMLLDTKLDKEQKEYAGTVKRSAEALLNIVNDILDFSKMEAGKLKLENINFSLRKVIADLQMSYEILSHKKGIEFICENSMESSKEYYYGDPGRLRQVLINLLSNALKFTPEKGKIYFRVLRNGPSHFRFEIQDTGIGISSEAQNRLFQAFEQADTSTSRKYGGTGLGLSICLRFVQLMGGKIGVHSEEGKGSTFWVSLPLKEGQKPETAADQETMNLSKVDEDTEFAGSHILVAEDNPVNQKITLKMLEQMGYKAHAVSDGAGVLEALEKDIPFSLILMDCHMPNVDGYAATRKLRSLNTKKASLPVIAMTASAFEGDKDKCLDAGMDDYVTKPIKGLDLFRMINKWLSRDKKFECIEGPLSNTNFLTKDSGLNLQHVDFATVQNIRQMQTPEDPDLFLDFSNTYLADTKQQLVAIENAVATNDIKTLVEVTHSLKVSSANIGAVLFSELCVRLEKLAHGDYSASTAMKLLELMKMEFGSVQIEFAAIINKKDAA